MFKTLMLLLTLLALGQSVTAFDRDQIDRLTKAASYTFDRICELHNPDPFFDEGVSPFILCFDVVDDLLNPMLYHRSWPTSSTLLPTISTPFLAVTTTRKPLSMAE